MIIHFFSFLITLIGWLLPVQDEPLHMKVSNKLATYSWNHPDEKIYLHTDKSAYVSGEDIWLKAYLMIGPYHVPDTMSSVLYVELIRPDGTLADRIILRMRQGLGWGDFHLPVDMAGGDYILKAYTRYMMNFDPAFHFRKPVSVLSGTTGIPEVGSTETSEPAGNIADSIHLKFFPEGGELVYGLQSLVAFKATDTEGRGLDVQGCVRNSQGDTLALIDTKKFGLGMFTIKPEPGSDYFACIAGHGVEQRYRLPEPLQKGYVMHINNHEGKIYLWVRNNLGISMDGSFVIGQFRGFPFITIHGKKDQDFIYTVLDTKGMPSGIIQFTFFDSSGIPRCERLVFASNEEERINFTMSSNKKVYKKREKAFFDIHCTGPEGKIVLTNLSLSVVNNALVNSPGNRSRIQSYFNLESDLKGAIEEPGYYFNPEHKDRFDLLDNLMLTHGWRKFVWKDLLADKIPEYVFPVESGFSVKGGLTDFYDRDKPRPGNVRLFIYENQLYYNEIKTDDTGHFRFDGLTIFDSTHVVMQAWEELEKKGKTRNNFTINIQRPAYAAIDKGLWPDMREDSSRHADYLDLNQYILKIDSSFEGRTVLLEEVTVRDRRIDPEAAFDRPGKLYKEPSRRIIMDSLHVEEQSLMLFDLLRKYFPGVQVRGYPPDVSITVRGPTSLLGNNNAMLFLDGLPADADFLYYFPVSEIAFIDLLNATKAAVYGSDAANGAIAFYSRQGPPATVKEERKGMINFIREGYYRAREFYVPDYDKPEEKHVKPDFRRTLYWNPSLTTDDQGNIEYSFFTSDETATYRIEVEGMTFTGIPFTAQYSFAVE